jgi:hypothetical protein
MDVVFSYWPSMGVSNGILSLWDTLEVWVWNAGRLQNFLIINGRFVKSCCIFFVSIVYAFCDFSGSQDF